jgi:invasion protein IalB
MKFAIVAATALLLAFQASTPAVAQAAKKAAEPQAAAPATAAPQNIEMPAQGWTVNCGNTATGLTCAATQSIIVAQTRQLLVAATVTKAAAGHIMAVHLPHGILLPAGASVQIDAEPAQTLVIETCDSRGCYANMPLPEKTVASMRTGTALNVTFQNVGKSNVKVQLPLGGFAEAIKKL